jgi:plasmid stability protein
MANVLLTARVPDDLVRSLRAHAALSDRSMSGELRVAIKKHLSTSNAPAANQGVAKADDGGRHRGS